MTPPDAAAGDRSPSRRRGWVRSTTTNCTGRVSVICPSCEFHETRDWFRSAITTPWEWEVPRAT